MTTRRLPATPWTLCGWLTLPYLLSILALIATGTPVPLPWRFLFHATGIALPYAYCLGRGVATLDMALARRRSTVPVVGLLLSPALLWVGVGLTVAGQLIAFALFASLLLRDVRQLPARFLRSLSGTLVGLTMALSVVWNLNYLLAPRLATFLRDPALKALDITFYEWALGRHIDYRNLFPLLESPLVFRVMENAYHMLFVEILVVLLVLLWTNVNPARFLRAVCLCYFVALITFYAFPAVGPCIYYPGTLRVEYQPTMTYQLMHNLAAAFGAAVEGTATDGFAYFIAIPSLHAALALLCQWALANSRLCFWTFLPVNIAVVLSTVLLGYHYVIDIPLGLILALAAILCVRQTTAQYTDSNAAGRPRDGWTPAG